MGVGLAARAPAAHLCPGPSHFKDEGRSGAPWVTQPVGCPTLDFGSDHDPRVMGLNSMLGCMLNVEPALRLYLSLTPSAPLPCSLSLSKKKI